MVRTDSYRFRVPGLCDIRRLSVKIVPLLTRSDTRNGTLKMLVERVGIYFLRKEPEKVAIEGDG